jgi:hypothetical protein
MFLSHYILAILVAIYVQHPFIVLAKERVLEVFISVIFGDDKGIEDNYLTCPILNFHFDNLRLTYIVNTMTH